MKTQNQKTSGAVGRTMAGSVLPAEMGSGSATGAHGVTRPAFAILWLVCFCGLLSAFCFRASGQTYSIPWYKVSGGGGTSTNGQYSLSGTIGQPDASGSMSGGQYSVTGGFWALYAVQTPGLPNLTITYAGGSAVVSWPNTGSYTLQQNNNPAAPAGWTASSYAITTANGTNSITVNPPAGNLFFRLKQ